MPGWRETHPIASLRHHTALRDGTKRELDRRLAEEQSKSRLPSVAAALVRDGRLAWFGGAGLLDGAPPTDETQYRCGSISKTFVAVATMRLRDEGLLDLSDPVRKHLPELGHFGFTVAQLLSHTSGLRSETSGPWWERTPGVPFEELVATSLREEDLLFRPGRMFHYSNPGYGILGELVKRLRARPWDEVVDDELLRPLGMVRTTTRPVPPFAPGFGVHPHADVILGEPEHDSRSMAPAGQLWSSVEDLARWVSLLAGLHPKVLAKETAEEMREPQGLIDIPNQPWVGAYGLGLQLWNDGGRRRYGHSGSMPGFLAFLQIDAESTDAVVVMANATSGLGANLADDLLRTLAEREPKASPAWQPARSGVAAELLSLAGTWYWGTSAFIFDVKADGSLDLTAIGRGRESKFAPVGDGTYKGLFGYYAGETLSVVRRGDASVSHLNIGSFVLTRTPYDPTAALPGGFDEAGWRGSDQGLDPSSQQRSHHRSDHRSDQR